MLFERILRRHEQGRQAAILGEAAADRWPSPFRGDRYGGFLPPSEAAKAMAMDVLEVARLARSGMLEWREVGGEVWIRPAAVSVLAVRDESGGT